MSGIERARTGGDLAALVPGQGRNGKRLQDMMP